MNWLPVPRGEGNKTCPFVDPIPPAADTNLALKVDLLAQVDELLCPLHGLHTGIALLHQLGRPWVGHLQPPHPPPNPGSQSPASDPLLGTRSSDGGGLIQRYAGVWGRPSGAELTSLSALKALVATSSSSEPCAVLFRMFWRVGSVQ